jgi:crotonobetainyl-CoA:carnitine CoA-transferase CaiB-like acyl-CoA transferase
MADAGTLARPLEGVVVVSLEQAVAAPFLTGRLADAGATVIKIERPEGDFARGYDKSARGSSSYFVWLNRGKRSVVIDLASDSGKAELSRLVSGADVFVQNLKPGAAARLGFDPAALCRTHPRLICCSISGFDADGPYGERKAYDLLIQAESGLCSITGGPEGPARVGISIVDIATGATAHAAVLEALIGRGINGRGADIRVSMFDVIADWLTVPLLNHEAGNSPKRLGLAHTSIAPYGVFSTGDGQQILISIQSEREWAEFCHGFLKAPAAITDPATATNVARVRNRSVTDRLVAEAFAGMTLDKAIDALERSGTAFAVVNDMEGLSRHPELKRIEIDTPGGPVSIPRPGALFAGAPRRYGPVPALGKEGAR